MRGWGRWVLLVLLTGFSPPKNGPPYSATDQPPPRGQPQPRLGELQPRPGPGPETWQSESDRQDRFPILENQQRKEQAARAQGTATGRVELRASKLVHACDGVAPDERLQCPLHDPKDVVSVTDVPDGARVGLRTDAVEPERLQHLLDCQKSQVTARPQAPTACPFYDAHTNHAVIVTEGQVQVLLRRPDAPDQLRGQVRSALAPTAAPGRTPHR
jgi:hypothetical protein